MKVRDTRKKIRLGFEKQNNSDFTKEQENLNANSDFFFTMKTRETHCQFRLQNKNKRKLNANSDCTIRTRETQSTFGFHNKTRGTQ